MSALPPVQPNPRAPKPLADEFFEDEGDTTEGLCILTLIPGPN